MGVVKPVSQRVAGGRELAKGERPAKGEGLAQLAPVKPNVDPGQQELAKGGRLAKEEELAQQALARPAAVPHPHGGFEKRGNLRAVTSVGEPAVKLGFAGCGDAGKAGEQISVTFKGYGVHRSDSHTSKDDRTREHVMHGGLVREGGSVTVTLGPGPIKGDFHGPGAGALVDEAGVTGVLAVEGKGRGAKAGVPGGRVVPREPADTGSIDQELARRNLQSFARSARPAHAGLGIDDKPAATGNVCSVALRYARQWADRGGEARFAGPGVERPAREARRHTRWGSPGVGQQRAGQRAWCRGTG
jgi:hypothetical protein